jgi:hypothetical protein
MHSPDRRPVSWAVISADMNPDYIVYLPITAACWKKLGYECLVILVGTPQQWNRSPSHRVVLESLIPWAGKIVWMPEFEGHKTHVVSQVSRIFAAGSSLPADDYLLTSDADMWPLDRAYFHKQDASRPFHVWYSNAYEVEDGVQKYPICYLGGKVKIWREIMRLGEDDAIGRLQNELDHGLGRGASGMTAWCYDERLFGIRFREWGGAAKSHMMIRSMREQGRIDRIKWKFSGSIAGKVDAHLLRLGEGFENWRKLRALAAVVLPEHIGWIDEFWRRFVATIPGARYAERRSWFERLRWPRRVA